jgi:hypothetical protein
MSNDLVPPPNSGISPEDWQQTPESVRAWITVLGAGIKHLKDTVEKLQDIVNRNSGNSSQPPVPATYVIRTRFFPYAAHW